MFGIFGGKSNDGPPHNLNEAKKLISKLGQARAGRIIRDGAMSGNLFCQKFLSQLGLAMPANQRPANVQQDTETFTEMAARSGDGESQFNMGNLCMAKVDASSGFLNQEGVENIKMAKQWYAMADKSGVRGARDALKNLDVFDF